jgi:hypothetical protein
VQVVAQIGITIPSYVCKVLSADAGECQEDADVLNIVRRPGILSATISETTNVQGQENVITFSFRPNIQLIAGTRIILSGLKGTITTDSFPGNRLPLKDKLGQDYAMQLIVSYSRVCVCVFALLHGINGSFKCNFIQHPHETMHLIPFPYIYIYI